MGDAISEKRLLDKRLCEVLQLVRYKALQGIIMKVNPVFKFLKFLRIYKINTNKQDNILHEFNREISIV